MKRNLFPVVGFVGRESFEDLWLSNQVTVGICAYNEDQNIGKLLGSVLSEQELPHDAEVLVVCSGCTDKTIETTKAYAEKDCRLKVIVEKERSGKASAINKILENATGRNILFVSADTLPTKNCFSKLTSRIQAPGVGIVSGRPVPSNSPETLVGRLVRALWFFHDHVFSELNDAGLARHASEIFCVRNGIIGRIPPQTVNDDAYIAVMARMKGWLIKYEPRAWVSISGPKTMADYLRQRKRIIFGHYQIRKLTGKSPQYLVHLAPRYPRKVLSLATWLCVRCGILTFLLFSGIELLLNGSAVVDLALGKSYARWSIASTTKIVDSQG